MTHCPNIRRLTWKEGVEHGFRWFRTCSKHCKMIEPQKRYLPSASQVVIVYARSCSFVGHGNQRNPICLKEGQRLLGYVTVLHKKTFHSVPHRMLHVEGLEVVKCAKHRYGPPKNDDDNTSISHWTHVVDFDSASYVLLGPSSWCMRWSQILQRWSLICAPVTRAQPGQSVRVRVVDAEKRQLCGAYGL